MYKEVSSSKWIKLVGGPDHFQCPPGIADPEDCCYQLKGLFFGVHYISSVIKSKIINRVNNFLC